MNCAIALISIALAVITSPPISAGAEKLPNIVEVQRRAIAHARLDASEISSWKKRARYQAFLPKLQVDYERRMRDFIDIDINDSIYVGSNGVIVGPDEGSYSYNNDAHQNFEVKATWSFNETIFNPDVLNISAEARRLSHERQSILALVTKNYYDLERSMGSLKLIDDEIRVGGNLKKLKHLLFLKQVEIKEFTANLDSLTGGWFSGKISEGG